MLFDKESKEQSREGAPKRSSEIPCSAPRPAPNCSAPEEGAKKGKQQEGTWRALLRSSARQNALGRGVWQGLSKHKSRGRSQGNPPGRTNPLAENPVCAPAPEALQPGSCPCNHISLPHLHCWSRATALQPSSSLQSSLTTFFFFPKSVKSCI